MVAPSSPVAWSPLRRVAFRFGFLFVILFVFPFPLDLVPKLGWLVELVTKPFDLGVDGLGHLFGEAVPIAPTDMGDTLYRWLLNLELAILATAGTIAWSIVDRRRLAYPRLAELLTIVVRYFLAGTMLYYGFAKLIGAQFPFPDAVTLEAKVGESSPMRVMWAFMGTSTPYSIFGGLAEVLGAVLLLWRRTATLGALVIAAVMTNVVMLNFCYDVSVKLFSTELLVASLALLAPHARRLVAATLGIATAAVPVRPRWSARGERARLAAKLAVLLLFAYHRYQHVVWWHDWVDDHSPAIAGIWIVEQQPEGERWERVAISSYALTVRRADQSRHRFGVELDGDALVVRVDGEPERWTYRLLAPDRVELAARRGTWVMRREPAGTLATHRMRWIWRPPS